MSELEIRNEFVHFLEDMPPEYFNKSVRAFEKMMRKYNLVSKEEALTVPTTINEDLVDIYLKLELAKGRPQTSVYNYEKALKLFFAAVNKFAVDVTSIDVINYLNSYKENRNISFRSLNAVRTILSSFFTWSAKVGYTKSNPVDLIPKFKEEKKERDYLSTEELEELRYKAKNLYESALIEFLVSTACRISEAASVRLSDIDWSDNSISILGKGNKRRRVTMTPKCRIAVDDYLASRGYGIVTKVSDINKTQAKLQRKLKRNGGYKDVRTSLEYLFVAKHTKSNPEGAPKESGLRAAFEKIVSRTSFAEQKWVTPHTLRHTWATLARRKGMSIEDISSYLGHENINTTMIYVAVDKERIRADVARFAV